MIFDTIQNLRFYAAISQNFRNAARFLQSTDLSELRPGEQITIDNERVYGFVVRSQSKPADPAHWEAHHRYADIQVILKGGQMIYAKPLEDCVPVTEYDSQKDITFYRSEGYGMELALRENYFAVFFPQDAHLPDCPMEGIPESLKLVIKVRVS